MKKNLKVELSSGIRLTLDYNRINNYELLEAIAASDENPLLVTRVVNLLLGENKKILLDSLREEDGFIPNEKIAGALEEIMTKVGELKN